MSEFDAAKLARLQALSSSKVGGARRKVTPRVQVQGDDKKLQAGLKKLAVQPIAAVDEVNMFLEGGRVLQFNQPKVHGAASANCYAVYGVPTSRALQEILPAAMAQLGPSEIDHLQNVYAASSAANAAAGGVEADDDEGVPELVQEVAPLAESGLEEIN